MSKPKILELEKNEKQKTTLIREIILEEDSNTVTIDNLDIEKDGGYLFELYGSLDGEIEGSNPVTLMAKINNETPSVGRVVGQQVVNGETINIANETMSGLMIARMIAGVISYTTGSMIFSKERKYVSYNAKSSSPVWYLGDFSSLASVTADNITSINITADKQMKSGFKIRLYSKGNLN